MHIPYPTPLRGPQLTPANNTHPSGTLCNLPYTQGPYIHLGRATNLPTALFLSRVRDPSFPALNDRSLLTLRVPETVTSGIVDPASTDPWQYYLSASLLRHYSYHHRYSGYYTDTDTDLSPRLQDRYLIFRNLFIVALNAAQAGHRCTRRRPSRDKLVRMECELTRDTFGAVLVLFEKCFEANKRLVQELDYVSRSDRVKAMGWKEVSKFLEWARGRLGAEWIALEGLEGVLAKGCVLAEEGDEVEEMRGALKERWCGLKVDGMVDEMMEKLLRANNEGLLGKLGVGDGAGNEAGVDEADSVKNDMAVKVEDALFGDRRVFKFQGLAGRTSVFF